MENKIQVQECIVNGDWANIKTPEGKQMSINLPKCPKLKAQLEGKVTPFELEGKVTPKGDRVFIWDMPDMKQGGFKGQPKNEKAIIAQSCIGYATNMLQNKSSASTENVIEAAEVFYQWVLKKGGIQ